jgi:purine-binding chemotaxis protein CheW
MTGTVRTEEHRIVVVDAVTEVSRIPSSSIEPPSTVITTNDSEYLTGIIKSDEKLIILLDIAKVISDSEQVELTEVQETADAVAA